MGGAGWRYVLVWACAGAALAGGCASPKPTAVADIAQPAAPARTATTEAGGPANRQAEIVPAKYESGASPRLVPAGPAADPAPSSSDILRPGRLRDADLIESQPAQVAFRPSQRAATAEAVLPSPGRTAIGAPPRGPRAPLAMSSAQRELPIDLPTALRLANADNLQVALAREQIREALAGVEAARVLWLPTIRGGVSYNRHEGSIQAVDGTQFNTSRGAFYSGLGGGVYGAGTPIVPGIYANFHLTDALFRPLAARQLAEAKRRAATAATNDALLSVSLAYLELLRAHEELAIAQAIEVDARKLAELTTQYARTGEGLQADADRLQVELTQRRNDVLRAEEACQVASARLAQLLHLDPTLVLQPIEPAVVAIDLVEEGVELPERVAQGLSGRPELAECRLLAAEAVTRLRRERLAPLLPSVLLGTSYGAMSAGINGNLAPGTGRLDADAVAYWELRNMGLGEQAARDGAGSNVRQARVRQIAMMDQIAREVTEASAQSQARRRQIEIAREGVAAAVHSHRRNLDRIQAAKGLPIEALQSVQALANAQREYLRTLVDYDVAQFTLFRALGWPRQLNGALSNLPRQAQPAPRR